MTWAPAPHPVRVAASTAASKAPHRGAGKTPSAKDHFARIDPAVAASRQHCVTESYVPWGSVCAPSSRFSGTSAPRYHPWGGCAAILYPVGRLPPSSALGLRLGHCDPSPNRVQRQSAPALGRPPFDLVISPCLRIPPIRYHLSRFRRVITSERPASGRLDDPHPDEALYLRGRVSSVGAGRFDLFVRPASHRAHIGRIMLAVKARVGIGIVISTPA